MFATPIGIGSFLGLIGVPICFLITKLYPSIDLINPFIAGLLGLIGIYYTIFLSLFLIVPIVKVVFALLEAVKNWNEYKKSNIFKLYPTGEQYIIPGSIFGFIALKSIDKFNDTNPFIDRFNDDYFEDMVEVDEVDSGFVSFKQSKVLNPSVNMFKYMGDNGYNFHKNNNRISMKIDDFCEIYRFTGKYNYDLNQKLLNNS
jgi:hypothetical protein